MQVNNRKPKRTKGGDKTLRGPRSCYQGHPIHGKIDSDWNSVKNINISVT